MKSIAFISMTSRMSGVEFSTLNLVRWLDTSRWSPIVVVPREGDLADKSREAGVRCVVVPFPKSYSVGLRVRNRTLPNPFALVLNAITSLYAAFQVWMFLRKERPVVAVTKGLLSHFFGGIGCAVARVPCVWHVQDKVSERLGNFYPLVLATAGRFLARHIIADAESIAGQLRLMVPSERVSVIWNGVDTGEFSPDVDGTGVRHEWSIADHDILIGSVARITPWKGQHLLLEAFIDLARTMPALKLVIVGSPMFDNDDYLHQLQAIVNRAGLGSRVIFAGFRWDLPRVLAAIDIFIHTAVEKDSSPLSVVSAMAAGKAIVCPRIDGIAELVRDEESALLYTPGDSKMLCSQLKRLITDDVLAHRMGIAARNDAVAIFGVSAFSEKCEAVFQHCVESSKQRLHG
jgi:glycosyltransferase involved in cell wall biosynthesis